MNREQPGRQDEDSNQTIRHRYPLPGAGPSQEGRLPGQSPPGHHLPDQRFSDQRPPDQRPPDRRSPDQRSTGQLPPEQRPPEQGQGLPDQGPPETPYTQRLPYTPDMLPDVPLYETKPPRSAWWWVIVAGGLVLLIAILAVAIVLWIRSTADASSANALGAGTAVTLLRG
ncbi:hypothetical protein GCM10022419_076900 [Nonomuraea rosea]|uniref:Uncharacterized protein n=1 Tax=Nonomuraea rosea TaxID=638574 RepID=A0ABP6YKK6_9ACTN